MSNLFLKVYKICDEECYTLRNQSQNLKKKHTHKLTKYVTRESHGQ